MQAIMLAAGKGSRLEKYTADNTKCMLEVEGIRLIDRVIRSLSEANIHKLILVLGYKKENVKEYLKQRYENFEIVYVDNDNFDTTNNIYSLYLAKDFLLEEDTILLESDLIYESSLIKSLCEFNDENAAVVSKYAFWMDGTVVTIDSENTILNFISKSEYDLNEIENYYKTVNIYKLNKSFSKNCFIPYLEAYMKKYGNNNYYEMVFKTILADMKRRLEGFKTEMEIMKAFPIPNDTWYEIDTEEDLKNAIRLIHKND